MTNQPPQDVREPWEQQEAETSKAFDAFRHYRDLGPKRTIRAAMDAAGVGHGSYRRWEQWSSDNAWGKRVRAWDRELDRARTDAEKRAVADMREAHIREARLLRSVAITCLERLNAKILQNSGQDISPGLLLQYLVQGQNLERLARGEPTEISRELEDRNVEVVWPDELPPDEQHEAPAEGDDAPDARGAEESPSE